jgi:hypothetical protein
MVHVRDDSDISDVFVFIRHESLRWD